MTNIQAHRPSTALQKPDEARGWQLQPAELADSHLDPLLACLLMLTRHFDRPMSADALVAGLPIQDAHLTPALFVRSASRAGLSARLVKRPLDKVSSLVLPAVLLLRDRRACVLTGLLPDGMAEVVFPEAGHGVTRVAMTELTAEYTGFAIFVRPEHAFDTRVDESRPRPKSWFWGTLFKLWPAYVEVIIAAAVINVLALAAPLFTMNVYDRVLPNQAISTLWVLAAGMGIALFFDFLLRSLRGALIDTAGRRADVLLASRLFEHVLNIQMKVRPTSTGAFANHLREFETVRDFFTSSTLSTLTDVLFIGLFIFVIYVIAGPLAYVPLVAVIIAATVGLLVQIPLARAVRQTSQEAAQKHAILVETVGALDTIKSLGGEGRMQRAWERFVGATSRTSQKSRFYSSMGVNLTVMTQQAVAVVTVIVGVYLVAANQMTMGGIIASVILGGRAVAPLAGLANTLSRFHQSKTALTTLNQLMELPVERPADRRIVSRPIEQGAIEMRDVTFSYPNTQMPALKNVSFKIRPGERVGIIGRIGSGKTTIGRLMIGLYEPDEGAVLIDDVDLRQYHPSDIRRGVGFVMQDVTLFVGSVRDNIAFAVPNADDAMILRAAKLGGVDDFIRGHPDGYNLQVGERGQNLSGGQRQSIALARALLQDPRILMLDEPTSAMDNGSEQMFVRRLGEILDPSHTLVLTTHRMSLLRLIDRLIVLEGGRILADGPREEVLRALQERRIALPAPGGGSAAPAPRPRPAAAGTPPPPSTPLDDKVVDASVDDGEDKDGKTGNDDKTPDQPPRTAAGAGR
ncbi:MAG: type I secretion system permease/ATPase [Inquilinaceae bacterium]